MANGRINHQEEALHRSLNNEMERKQKRELDDDIESFKHKYSVVVKSQNVYSILNEVYKTLLKKDKAKHDIVKKYFTTGKQLLTIENIFNQVEDFVEFIGEDENRSQWVIHRFEDFGQLRK